MSEQQDLNTMSTTELAKHFISKLEEKERLEKKTTAINKEIGFYDFALTEKMDGEDIDSLDIDGMKLSRVTDEQFVLDGVNEGETWDREDGLFFQWLKEIGEEKLIKTKLSVHHKTRSSFLKSMADNGIDLPDFIKTIFWNHVKYNKAEIKRRVADE